MDETSPTMAVLAEYECWQLLQSHRPRLGRLAFVDAGWPLVLPVNYLAVGTLLYIRTAPGSKLLASAKLQQVLRGRRRRRGVRGGVERPGLRTPAAGHR